MKYYTLLILGFMFISLEAHADFVDIATLSVNKTIVRRVTRNSLAPYLINLSNYNIGDTLRIKVWTDNGAEDNSFITIKNEESQHSDTLRPNEYFLITQELLSKKHLISVIYMYSYPKKGHSIWNICSMIPDNTIETLYKSGNDLRNYLVATFNKMTNVQSQILSDSIRINFRSTQLENGSIQRRNLKDTIVISYRELPNILKFNKNEKACIEQFNAIDYFQMYAINNDIHGDIIVNKESLEEFWVTFGGYKSKVVFHLKCSQNKYVLYAIYHNEY